MQIEFLHPTFLLLLPLYLLIVWFLNRHFRVVEFSNLKLLKKAVKSSFDYSKILKFLIALFMVLALATPVKKQMHQANKTKGYDISILLDASDSMQEDNRFNVAKNIIANFLKQRKNDNIALSLFANYAYVASPLTYDKKSIEQMLKFIKLGVAGSRQTALNEALFLGADIFKKSDSKNRVMILLTDGINTVNSVSLQSAISRIKSFNIKVYTIALGKRGDFNKELLERIAKQSGGKFYQALKPEELELIYSEIDKLESGKVESKSYATYTHYFQYPIAIALILLIIYGILYKKSYSKPLLIATAIFMLIALYRPQSTKNILTSQSNTSFAVAVDLSYSMDAKDIYPNRLAFAKSKIEQLLKELTGQSVALYAYANEGYLISPATKDYERLIYLVKNLEPIGIKRDRADILKLLKTINVSNKELKSVIIFSSTNSEYKEALNFANRHKIKLYIYAVATAKGSIVKVDGRVLKDSLGNIELFELKSLKALADATSGAYKTYSLSNNLEDFISAIDSKTSSPNPHKQKDELFYIPLMIAFILYILSLIRRKLWKYYYCFYYQF